MGQDDDADCVGHVWRLDEVAFAGDGSWSTYRCERCPGVLMVEPGGVHPETV